MKKKMIWIPFLFIGMAALVGWILMLLWNWLMPDLFGIAEINYWQALGLLLLSKIIFGGIWHHKKCCHHKHGYWKHKFKHKWHSMSEEEKRKWEEKFGSHCGFGRKSANEGDIGITGES